jgi:hypothetical protein
MGVGMRSRRGRKAPEAGSAEGPRGGPRIRSDLIEMRVRGGPPSDQFSDLWDGAGGDVRLIACRPERGGGGPKLLRWLELDTSSHAGRQRLSALVHRTPPTEISVAQPTPERAYVRLLSPLPSVCAAVYASGALCSECPLLHAELAGGPTTTRLLVGRSIDAGRLRRALVGALGPGLVIERTGPLRRRSRLTRRQAEAFRTALDLGYFARPRRAGLAEVGRHLHIGRSAVSELLRRAIEELGRDVERGPARDAVDDPPLVRPAVRVPTST